MRTIKFRGKRVNGKGWIYGMPAFDFKYIFADGQTDSPDNYEVDPATVGQFTGLLDKDGKEIYEGDVTDDGLVRYEEEYLGFFVTQKDGQRSPLYDIPFSEILGNIHDNPELLNQ